MTSATRGITHERQPLLRWADDEDIQLVLTAGDGRDITQERQPLLR